MICNDKCCNNILLLSDEMQMCVVRYISSWSSWRHKSHMNIEGSLSRVEIALVFCQIHSLDESHHPHMRRSQSQPPLPLHSHVHYLCELPVHFFQKPCSHSLRGGRLTSLDASFMRCFVFFQTSSKTSRSMFFSKHRWNIASLSKKCDVLRDVLGLGPQRQKWLGPTILMPLWYNIACHASIFVNKLLE